ncbi:tetratricopeptide repeat protein [Shewanella sp. A32]|uniref:tetratricopeptide repeat protein n=1 Tax=Shewanella sp. A32 TaxID=3031327 RepID=UPI0023B9AE7D|nr:tetratricopeptide repeat protein [Shewanella sp. A32]MDF0535227.1 tetratricopeptide repeat protein [Shewanella sp. A32]
MVSVVNQMLKDLDKRQQPHSLRGIPNTTTTTVSATASWRGIFIGVAIGVVLVAAGGYGWRQIGAKPASGNLPAVIASTHTAAVPFASKGIEPTALPNVSPVVADKAADASPAGITDATSSTLAAPSAEPVTADEAVAEAAKILPSPRASATETTQSVPDVAIEHTVKTTGLTPVKSQAASSSVKNTTVAAKASVATAKPQQMQITEVKLTPEQLARKQYQHGMSAQQNGDLEAAVAAFQRALEIYPALHQARTQLAALYYGSGQLPQAEELLQTGVSAYPTQQQLWLLLGRVQSAQGKTAAATASLHHIADDSGFATDKWLTLAKLGQENQNWPLVQQSYRKLIETAPNDGRWWLGLAHGLDAGQRYPAAADAYRDALKRDNLSVEARAYIENRIAQIGDSQ